MLPSLRELGIPVKDGPHYYALCPQCSSTRRKSTEKCLSVHIKDDAALIFCAHCNWSGKATLEEQSYTPLAAFPEAKEAPPEYLTPVPTTGPVMPLSDEAIGWFMTRGISKETLEAAGVVSKFSLYKGKEQDLIGFPYKKDGKPYAHKVRTFTKEFFQHGSCVTYWLDEQVIAGEDLIICEGEIDALSIKEIGHTSVVSIPCGAVAKVKEGKIDPDEGGKFAFLWDGRDLYEKASRVIIAMDSDVPGQATAEEIARRIGKATCWQIKWPDGMKDANDVLVKLGAQELKRLIENPEPWPIAGVYNAKHYEDQVKSLYQHGSIQGESTGFSNVDELYTVVPGHLAVITGAPGSGKTSFLSAMMVNLARDKDWKFAVYSTEIEPELHIAYLAALYLEKPFFAGPTPRLSNPELDQALDFIQEHFIFISGEDGPSYSEIIDRVKTAVLRMGIVGALIDPASYLVGRVAEEGGSEAVGQMLEAFKAVARSHDIAVLLVAHPYKLRPRDNGSIPIPRGYEVSGSAHWANRPDFGITIHRDQKDRSVTQFHVWKVRFTFTGKEGKTELYYDPPTGRYSEVPFTGQQGVVYSGLNDPWDFTEGPTDVEGS